MNSDVIMWACLFFFFFFFWGGGGYINGHQNQTDHFVGSPQTRHTHLKGLRLGEDITCGKNDHGTLLSSPICIYIYIYF